MDSLMRRQSETLESLQSRDPTSEEIFDSGTFEWSYYRSQCKTFELENLYNTYIEKLQRSYLSLFFVIHTILGIAHASIVVAFSNDDDAISSPIVPDVFSYLIGIIIIWVTLISVLKDDLVKKFPWVPYIASSVAVFALVLTDLLIPLYHAANFEKSVLRPAYGAYTILVIYIFLPITNNWHAGLYGIAASCCYLVEMWMVTFRLEDDKVIKIITEAIFFLCLNIFGTYFRITSEVSIRKTFLDRRACVEGNLILKFAREDEKDLLLSILPVHIARNLSKDIRRVIESMKIEKRTTHNLRKMLTPKFEMEFATKRWRGQPISKVYTEKHSEVSILFADIVNYTYITTTLNVKTLVETLHELFVAFDQASEDNNVLRIKFLGDCYYAVSGLPVKNDQHAKNCVELGLRMIKIIGEVRSRRELNIDMRIGVHSGSLIGGVIGGSKWQYDVWSKDVDIANRMESTGRAGKVHVTQQTLDLLEDEYFFDMGTDEARKDLIFRENNIRTYLISPQSRYLMDSTYIAQEDASSRRISKGIDYLMRKKARKSKTTEVSPSGRNNFMQNSMQQYGQIMKETNAEMMDELNRMPIGKLRFDTFFKSKSKDLQIESDVEKPVFTAVSPIFLNFRSLKMEWKFLREPDLMLKYSVLMSFIIYLSVIAIQIINNPKGNIFWLTIVISGAVLIFLITITWFRKLWIIFGPVMENDKTEATLIVPPSKRILRYFYEASKDIPKNTLTRTLIYLTIVVALLVCSFIHLIECYQKNEFEEILITSTVLDVEVEPIYRMKSTLCANTWSVTLSVLLATCMCFFFMKINFLLKLVVGVFITGFWGWIVLDEIYYIFQETDSINPTISPNMAHFLSVLTIAIIFHLLDRQIEYISRVDYNWKHELLQKQKEAEFTKDTNRILLQNILPVHVAEIYINRQLKDELYYEEYDNVSIIFAAITNYKTNASIETGDLSILNQIICDFDDILEKLKGPSKVEKIKISGWTYMAACGLEPGRGDSASSIPGLSIQRSSLGARRSLLTTTRKSGSRPARSISTISLESNQSNYLSVPNGKASARYASNVVCSMAEFALSLMRQLRENSIENLKKDNPGLLRIGISHGKVMAGVIGSSKPLYDVWGNAVNMASRMESTGIPGKIQVTKDTADVLQKFGIKCESRGEVYVKGPGNIPTYLVCIDENLEFVRIQPEIDSFHGEEFINFNETEVYEPIIINQEKFHRSYSTHKIDIEEEDEDGYETDDPENDENSITKF